MRNASAKTGEATFNAVATENIAYNDAIIRLEHRSAVERWAFIALEVLIGTRVVPGLLQ